MSTEERKLRALEGIKGYLGDLVKVMSAINGNLVDFAKQIQDSDDKYDETMKEKGDMMALIPRTNEPPKGYAGGLGEAFRTPYKKEGE